MAKFKTRSLSKNVKIDPQEYVYHRGPPPSTIYKNSKNIEQTLFWWAKIKTRSLSKNIKIDPQEYVLQGSPPPSTIYKNSKNRQRTQFWWAKIKTRSLSKNVKIDPKEYVYQGSPPPSTIYKNYKNGHTKIYLMSFVHVNVSYFWNFPHPAKKADKMKDRSQSISTWEVSKITKYSWKKMKV